MSCSSKRIDLSVKGVKTSSQSDPYGDGPGLEAPEEVLQGIVEIKEYNPAIEDLDVWSRKLMGFTLYISLYSRIGEWK